jgi:capsular polysaccharide export protein
VSSLDKNQDRIVLFAFRNSQKEFFNELMEKCKDADITLLFTKRSWCVSPLAFVKLKEVDLDDAVKFGIDEFYAKTNLRIPRCVTSAYFKIFAWINFLRYYTALDGEYTKMLIWNGGKYRQRIALEAAKLKEIKVYYFENGLLPHTIVFDERGINYENSLPRESDFYKEYTQMAGLPSTLTPRIGKGSQKFTGEKEGLPQNYIFVPFQVDYDTQIISHSHWIKNMRMLFDVIESLAPKSDYAFVLKEHPSSGIKYKDLYARVEGLSNVSFQNTYSTQELIENSKGVITINSTVGIESLLFHKRVMVLGDAFYAIDGITRRLYDQNELLDCIVHLETWHLDTSLIDKFLMYVYHEYLIPKDDTMYQVMCQKITQSQK